MKIFIVVLYLVLSFQASTTSAKGVDESEIDGNMPVVLNKDRFNVYDNYIKKYSVSGRFGEERYSLNIAFKMSEDEMISWLSQLETLEIYYNSKKVVIDVDFVNAKLVINGSSSSNLYYFCYDNICDFDMMLDLTERPKVKAKVRVVAITSTGKSEFNSLNLIGNRIEDVTFIESTYSLVNNGGEAFIKIDIPDKYHREYIEIAYHYDKRSDSEAIIYEKYYELNGVKDPKALFFKIEEEYNFLSYKILTTNKESRVETEYHIILDHQSINNYHNFIKENI